MINYLILLCALLGINYESWYSPRPPTFLITADSQDEVLRKIALRYVQTTIDFLKKAIEQSERLAAQAELLGPPEEAETLHQEAENAREELKKFMKTERELWEQQPGGILAPPPRKVQK
jgi:hypothetical protein